MINNNGFNLTDTLTNQDISLTYTPLNDVYSFKYTVYKDGKVYIIGDGLNTPVNFNFTDTGIYNVEVIVESDTGFSTFSSSNYVIDKEKPVITVLDNSITMTKGATLDLFSDVSVTDNYNSNLKDSITTNYDEIDFSSLGQKKLIYTVDDLAGNTTSKTVYINVVSGQSPYLIYIQYGILLTLILFMIAILKYRHSAKLESRIAKFSLEPLEDNDVSLFDRLAVIIIKYIKMKSKFFDKSVVLKRYAKHYEKYTVLYNDKLTSMDLVSLKISLGGVFILVGIFSLAFKLRVLSIYEWIIPFIIGVFILDIYYALKYKIYRSKIENDLLQAIIIMNNAFKSGRSISQAVELVTTELDGPIAKEFSKIYVELSFGLDLNTVFKRFSERVNVEEATYLTASLTILNKTGGNIVKVFSAIEKSLFNKKKLKLELNSLTSSSRIIKNILSVVPLAFFVLISLIDSDYFSVFFTTNIGIILFGFILILYISYILVVNKVMKVRV